MLSTKVHNGYSSESIDIKYLYELVNSIIATLFYFCVVGFTTEIQKIQCKPTVIVKVIYNKRV